MSNPGGAWPHGVIGGGLGLGLGRRGGGGASGFTWFKGKKRKREREGEGERERGVCGGGIMSTTLIGSWHHSASASPFAFHHFFPCGDDAPVISNSKQGGFGNIKKRRKKTHGKTKQQERNQSTKPPSIPPGQAPRGAAASRAVSPPFWRDLERAPSWLSWLELIRSSVLSYHEATA